jgi:hypothetical protein
VTDGGKKKPPTPTWITLADALVLVLRCFISEPYAKKWLLEQLAAERLRWRAKAIDPPDELFNWRNASADWAQSAASKAIILGMQGAMGVSYVWAYGIEIAKEDLPETSLPGRRRSRRKRPVGRPRDYEHDKIAGIAESYIATYGLPRTQALLIEKTEDGCKAARVQVPGETVLKEIVSGVWRKHKQSRKVGN